jgi:hypothetical protein
MQATKGSARRNLPDHPVSLAAKKPQDGKVSFHISQSPGVYFYRIKAAEQDLKGKVVLY